MPTSELVAEYSMTFDRLRAAGANPKESRMMTQAAHNCVEVAITSASIGIRDTKQQGTGPILSFTHEGWSMFLDGLKSGEFDLSA